MRWLTLVQYRREAADEVRRLVPDALVGLGDLARVGEMIGRGRFVDDLACVRGIDRTEELYRSSVSSSSKAGL
jgi:hypothetical protein